MFEPLLIVVFESLSVKRWISESYSHFWKGFKYAGKLKNIQDLEDFFLKKSAQFNCSEQTRVS